MSTASPPAAKRKIGAEPFKALVVPALRWWLGEVRWLGLKLKLGRIITYYDRLTEMVMQRILTPTAVCVDVGCHSGEILRLMTRHAPQGQFLAFEPVPELCTKLRSDFDLPDVVRPACTGRPSALHNGFFLRTFRRSLLRLSFFNDAEMIVSFSLSRQVPAQQ
jgi:hypothetical protein